MKDEARLFKALSDPNRLRIVQMLQVRPLCVCEIQELLKLAPSTVSKHLSILREAGFIYDIKEGKWVYYYIDNRSSNPVVIALQNLIKKHLANSDVFQSDRKKVLRVDRNKACGVRK